MTEQSPPASAAHSIFLPFVVIEISPPQHRGSPMPEDVESTVQLRVILFSMPAGKKSVRRSKPNLHLTGVELYFDDLPRAKKFYRNTLGLELAAESNGNFAQFDAGGSFVCVERKGSENYPSLDKAVLFFEVPDLAATVDLLGHDRILRYAPAVQSGRPSWAVLHDTEGHNILLIETRNRKSRKRR
jgi:predicted enzyme related to lactoylglutathione lyase